MNNTTSPRTYVNSWLVRKRILARTVLVVCVYTTALLVYPTLTSILGLIALVRFRAYEVLGAGLVLDVILAPGGGMVGAYTYTTVFIVGALLLQGLTFLIRGSTTS